MYVSSVFRIHVFTSLLTSQTCCALSNETSYIKNSGVAQWIVLLKRNGSVMSSNPIKGSHCCVEQESLLYLPSTGWFQVIDSRDFTFELK